MIGKNEKSKGMRRLRSRAEAMAREQGGVPTQAKTAAALSHEEALRLVHELRVHQIELKLQNEELCRAQAQLCATQQRYFDFYNLAPVGYFIVAHDGRILEANLAGVGLLGVPQVALVKQPLTRFILTEDQDIYYRHRRHLLATDRAHTCELRMVKSDGTAFWARLTAIAQGHATSSGSDHGKALPSRVVLIDISEQRQAAQDKAELDARLKEARQRRRVGAKPTVGKALPAAPASRSRASRRGRRPDESSVGDRVAGTRPR